MSEKANELSQSQKILNAAYKCISTKGYANVSLRDIADEAGVVLSQLNYYYKNKEGLFLEIVKTLAQKYLTETEEYLKKSRPEKEQMAGLIKYFQEILTKNPELFKLLFDLTSMSLWSASLKELLNDLFKRLADLINKYIVSDFSHRENLKNYSPAAVARIVLGTLFGTSIQVILADEKVDMLDSLAALNVLFE